MHELRHQMCSSFQPPWVQFTLFLCYTSAWHVWYQVFRAVYNYCRTSYIWCVVFIVVALATVFKKVIAVVEFFVFYSLLSINLCLGVLGLVDNYSKDDIIFLGVIVIFIIR